MLRLQHNSNNTQFAAYCQLPIRRATEMHLQSHSSIRTTSGEGAMAGATIVLNPPYATEPGETGWILPPLERVSSPEPLAPETEVA
jgi:hypothetical protein